MAMSMDPCAIVPLEYDIFFGLDIDKKSISITILDHTQKIKSLKVPNDANILINYVRNKFTGKRVVFAYEAGALGYTLYDNLTKAGYTCVVTSPSMVPRPAGSRVKTNRIDSQRLAYSLRGGELRSIRVPSPKYRDLRHFTHLYKTTLIKSSGCKYRIKALLLLEGIPYPDTDTKQDHWSYNTIKKLEELKCRPPIRFKLDILLESLRFYREQILKIKRELRNYCRSDADIADSVRFLMSIPGIGWITSIVILSRIGDWQNLRNVRELAGFLGLTPCERSTGEETNKGNITHLGDSYVRNLLIEGAWSAAKKDPELSEFYQRILSRHPQDRASRKAVVAVARKLTSRIYAVLTQRRLYSLKSEEYDVSNKESNKKRRQNAPKDASVRCRVRKYVLKGEDNYSPVLAASRPR